MLRSRQPLLWPLTILPVIDADASEIMWQDLAQEQFIAVMNAIFPAPGIALTWLEPMWFHDLSPEQIHREQDLLIVPWSDGREGRDDAYTRHDGTTILAHLLGRPLPPQLPILWPQRVTASFMIPANLSTDAHALSTLCAIYPGWDRQATVTQTEEKGHWVILRQPQYDPGSVTKNTYPAHMVEHDQGLYARYLAHWLSQIIRAWPQGTNQ